MSYYLIRNQHNSLFNYYDKSCINVNNTTYVNITLFLISCIYVIIIFMSNYTLSCLA